MCGSVNMGETIRTKINLLVSWVAWAWNMVGLFTDCSTINSWLVVLGFYFFPNIAKSRKVVGGLIFFIAVESTNLLLSEAEGL